jgi:O-methyltransferase involved in polyketide biosynthesis
MENIENKTELQDQTIQSTMLLAVYGRAKASKLFPDILRDGEAIRIVDNMDYDFAKIDKTYGGEYACLCTLLRAKRLDERCSAYIKAHPKGTVINLGAGLDTTFSRVDNGSIRWYNVDLADSMAFRHKFISESGAAYRNKSLSETPAASGYSGNSDSSAFRHKSLSEHSDIPDASDSSAFRNKFIPEPDANLGQSTDNSMNSHKFIPPRKRCFDIAKSMFDYSWLDEIKTSAADGVFILAGGLFYYFKEERIRELVSRLAEHFPKGEIFFDAQSKTAAKISNRMVKKTGNKGSDIYFFVNDPQKLREWSPKIQKIESVPFFGEFCKDKRFKLSTKINMLGFDKLKMGYIISIQW